MSMNAKHPYVSSSSSSSTTVPGLPDAILVVMNYENPDYGNPDYGMYPEVDAWLKLDMGREG